MGVIKNFNYRATVAPGTMVQITKNPQVEGVIREIIAHWPAGCGGPAFGALVWIAVYVGGVLVWPQISSIPADNWIALDDATEKWTLTEGKVSKSQREWIHINDSLMVEVYNYDGVNPHTPSITVSIEVEKTGEG